MNFQLPSSSHFGFRAFQSFRRPGFCLLHPLCQKIVQIVFLQLSFCVEKVYFSHLIPRKWQHETTIICSSRLFEKKGVYCCKLKIFLNWDILTDQFQCEIITALSWQVFQGDEDDFSFLYLRSKEKDKQVREGNIKPMTWNLDQHVMWPGWHTLGTAMLYMPVLNFPNDKPI